MRTIMAMIRIFILIMDLEKVNKSE
jgi:hypothetical protein